MREGELAEIHEHIGAVLNAMFTDSAAGNVRAHLIWEFKEILSRVRPEDMRDSELAAAIAVFHPVHSRVLSPPVGRRPTLRVIPALESPQLGESLN